MELYIEGFSEVTNHELFSIEGGRDVSQVAIGTIGLVAITGAIVVAAIYCPAAITPGSLLSAAGSAVSCVQMISSGW